MEELAIYGGMPASPKVLGYGHQDINENDVKAVTDCLRGDYLTCGPATEAFEESIRSSTGAGYVTAVANGTAALHVACLAAGIGPGDEVIVSPITFAASANCVRYCGGTPVFADIDPKTWNISPASIRRKLTDRTKAVVAVDFGGVQIPRALLNIALNTALILPQLSSEATIGSNLSVMSDDEINNMLASNSDILGSLDNVSGALALGLLAISENDLGTDDGIFGVAVVFKTEAAAQKYAAAQNAKDPDADTRICITFANTVIIIAATQAIDIINPTQGIIPTLNTLMNTPVSGDADETKFIEFFYDTVLHTTDLKQLKENLIKILSDSKLVNNLSESTYEELSEINAEIREELEIRANYGDSPFKLFEKELKKTHNI